MSGERGSTGHGSQDDENQPGAERDGPFAPLEAIFLLIQKDSDKKHISPRENPTAVTFGLYVDTEFRKYILHISPAHIVDGVFNEAALNLYEVRTDKVQGKHGQEVVWTRQHMQQWLVRTTWVDGEPKITDKDIDPIIVQTDGNIIGLLPIAERAREILQERGTRTSNQQAFGAVFIPKPPNVGSIN